MNDIDILPDAQTHMPGGLNIGATSIEQQRAIAEVKGKIAIAKMFPRSMAKANADFMEACQSADFAATAIYTVKNRGSGPSIRFAEEVARCYGNFSYGHRELSRSDSKTEVEVFAWDVENNNLSTRQITVLHIRDSNSGAQKLTNQNDINGAIANVASKQMRSRILALVPKALVAAGVNEVRKTLAGSNDKTIASRVNDMTKAFAKYGVTLQMLTAYLGHSLDNTTSDELVDLMGVFNALRDGDKVADHFDIAGSEAVATSARIAADLAGVPAGDSDVIEAEPAKAKPATTPAPAPEKKASAPAQAQPAATKTTTRPTTQRTTAASPPPAPVPPPPPPPAAAPAAQSESPDGRPEPELDPADLF